MLEEKVLDYIASHEQEAYDLLLTIAQIPSPSNHEEKRAEFCKSWLKENGAKGVFIDEALNVVYPIAVTESNPVAVVMAHTDVVFPDTTPLPLKIEDGKLCCPGVGDDTANLVVLLMAARYLNESGLADTMEAALAEGRRREGLVLVCNAGEEGLGNLKGSKQICAVYGKRITEFISLDGGLKGIVDHAVGSKRFKVRVRTIGGHSYGAFGNPNAIEQISGLIQKLYQIQVPPVGKTTYNVGMISGGTSVNTIAQFAEMMYEFRSDSQAGLDYMQEKFDALIREMQEAGKDVEVELVGLRPGHGPVDPDREQALLKKCAGILKTYTGEEPTYYPGSTDCNIPFSMGIPSACFGCYIGKGAHTREEYVEIDSLKPGYRVGFDLILGYCR